MPSHHTRQHFLHFLYVMFFFRFVIPANIYLDKILPPGRRDDMPPGRRQFDGGKSFRRQSDHQYLHVR